MKNFFLAIIILSSAVVATGPIQDPDLWWHIKTGEIILEKRALPREDVFTFTASKPWRAYSWLPEILFYVTSKSGPCGLILLRILLLCMTSILLYLVVDAFLKNPQISALAVFVGWCSAYPVWELRPHIISFFLAAALSGIIALRMHGVKMPSILLPLIFLVWVNCHIYYGIGIFIFFLYVVADAAAKKKVDTPLLILFFLSVAATLLNPYGPAIYRQFFELAGHSWTWRWVMEMARPYPWDGRVWAFWLYNLAAAAVIYIHRKHISAPIAIMLIFSFLYSVTALRHIAFFPVISLPLLSLVVSSSGRKFPLPSVSAGFAALSAAVLFVAFSYRLATDFKNPVAKSVPVSAAKFLKENKHPQPIANYFDFGGYFIYSLWPEYKIFMDGRTQIFSRDFLDDYARLQTHEPDIREAEKIFEKYKIKTIIWATEHPLTESLIKAGCRAVYKDETAVILKTKFKLQGSRRKMTDG